MSFPCDLVDAALPPRLQKAIEAMRKALRTIIGWAAGCALLSGGVAILAILASAWLKGTPSSSGQIWGSASFGFLFGMLTGLLIAYLHSSEDELTHSPRQRLFDPMTLTLITLLLSSTIYWVLRG